MNRLGKKSSHQLGSKPTPTPSKTKVKKPTTTTKTTKKTPRRAFASKPTYSQVTSGVSNQPPKREFEIDEFAQKAVESFGPQSSTGPLASISRYNKVNPDTQMVKCMTPLERQALAEKCANESYSMDGGSGSSEGVHSLSDLHVNRPQSTFNYDACPPRVMKKDGSESGSGKRKLSQQSQHNYNKQEQQQQRRTTSSSNQKRQFSTSISTLFNNNHELGLGMNSSATTQQPQRPMDFSRSELKFQLKHRFSTRGQRMRFATENRSGQHQSPTSTTASSPKSTPAAMTDKIDQSKRQMKSGVRDLAEKAKDAIDSGTKSWTQAIEKTSAAATTAAEKFHQVSETVKTSAEELKHEREKLTQDFQGTEKVMDATMKQAKTSFSRTKDEIGAAFNKNAEREGLVTPTTTTTNQKSSPSSSSPTTGSSSSEFHHKM